MKTESLGDMLLKLAAKMERMTVKRNHYIDTLIKRGDDQYVRTVRVRQYTVREHTRSRHVRHYIIRKRR